MIPPRISIVTPSFNQGQFLEECMDSVLSQKYPNLEYIVMDGGSTDNSIEIIKKYQKHLAYWQSKPDGGQYKAINEGFKKTSGEIMAWLNSDDKYHSAALLKVAYLFSNHKGIEWLMGRPTVFDRDGNFIYISAEYLPSYCREKYLFTTYREPCIQQESTFWRRSLWEKAGGMLRTDLDFAGDMELWVRFFRYAQLFTVEMLLGGYRLHGNQKAALFMDKYIKEADKVLDDEIVLFKKGKFTELLPMVDPVAVSHAEMKSFVSAIYDANTQPASKLSHDPDLAVTYYLKKAEQTEQFLRQTRERAERAEAELNSTGAELNSTRAELNSTRAELNSTRAELANIYESYTWKTVSILQKVLIRLIPEGSVRRIKNYLMKFKPRKKRKINENSKKIVYIGHSYHDRTKSTVFLIEYLKQFYDVEEILDESWQGKPFVDLSFIDENYLGVIFLQVLPSKKIIQNIKNDNIIYFPMYDQSGKLKLGYWSDYRNLKIINFSKDLHGKLERWGFESMFVQYFPKPDEFIPGNKNEVFFWQRRTQINIKTILKLFKKDDLKIHIHKTIDPSHEFIQPSREEEEKFKITYSDWFDTREDMWGVIKQKGIYVAPREYEGIGMSFLEAMAMGKAVIAVDNPTMNEYIEHNKTGYLFNLKKPVKIDLSNIEEVQKNTYKYMQEGYEKWEKDKIKIIKFIKQP
jgi:glycosyltransferase involved in cell wall biosynthesis